MIALKKSIIKIYTKQDLNGHIFGHVLNPNFI